MRSPGIVALPCSTWPWGCFFFHVYGHNLSESEAWQLRPEKRSMIHLQLRTKRLSLKRVVYFKADDGQLHNWTKLTKSKKLVRLQSYYIYITASLMVKRRFQKVKPAVVRTKRRNSIMRERTEWEPNAIQATCIPKPARNNDSATASNMMIPLDALECNASTLDSPLFSLMIAPFFVPIRGIAKVPAPHAANRDKKRPANQHAIVPSAETLKKRSGSRSSSNWLST